MGLQEIGIELNEALEQFTPNAGRMSPYEIANFLRINRDALWGYIENSNEQLGEGALGYINPIAVDKILSILSELIDNFFPMAHTDRPLGQLKIVDLEKIREIEYILNGLRRAEEEKLMLNHELSRILGNL
jgi:hypothetical protein